jgi:hypothetical protein
MTNDIEQTDNKDLLLGKLKEMIKELIKASLEEISTSGAAVGYSTPFAFGKAKNVTAGLPGFTQVGNTDSGTLDEKKKDENKAKPQPKPVPAPNKIDITYKAVITKREKAAGQKGDKEGVKLYKKLGHLAKIQGVK